MEELCTACLCAGRKLYFINETGFENLYSQIIYEIPVYNIMDLHVRICWECKALLRRLGDFREQVKRCYTELLAFVHQNTAKPFANYPRLQIRQVHSASYPEEIKQELEDLSLVDDEGIQHDNDDYDVKSEEAHCEPETFVKDLNVAKVKKKKVKKVGKPIKEKSKRKVKIKKEVKPRHVSGTVESLIDSTINDCFNKQQENNEEIGDEERVDNCEIQPTKQKTKRKVKIKKDVNKSQGKMRHDTLAVESTVDSTISDTYNEQENNEEIGEENVDKCEREIKIIKSNNINKSDVIKRPLPDRPTCGECGKSFSSRKTYRYHLNVLHKGQNRYPCPRCGKVYQWKSNLGRHMRSHKARDSDELYCETCDKRFASVATYRQHLKISRRHVSESEFTFTCNECGKKFVNKTRLRDHIDWEHLKKIKFKCQLCNKPFKCHTSLYVHMQNVHRSKDKKDNLCHVCGKSYQNAAKLKYHIVAMHTSETPYQCQQCNAAFGWYSSLYRHVREVHYKMKVQPKKSKKIKKSEVLPSLLPMIPQQILLPPMHQPGPAAMM